MPTADGRILSMDYINLNPFPFCFMQLMHISNSSLIFKQQQRRPRKYLKVLIFCSFSQFPQKQTNVAALECYIISSTQIIYTTKQACRRNWKGKPATLYELSFPFFKAKGNITLKNPIFSYNLHQTLKSHINGCILILELNTTLRTIKLKKPTLQRKPRKKTT
jgi:hypothetical protein